jgi:membrane protein implicated in regulation of membrane protease activity
MALTWFLLAVIALLGELFTLSFYLVYEAAAAAVTGVFALFVPNIIAQLLVFAVASALALGVARPRTIQLLFRAKPEPTVQFPDVVGKGAVVRERVTDTTGLVEVGAGEFWSARSAEPGLALEPGTSVTVARRDGIRLFVTPAGKGNAEG